jgi:hypothetical protein
VIDAIRHARPVELRAFLRLGPLLILAFIAESLVAKGSFPGLRIGFALHMLLTAGLLGLMAIAGEVMQLRCSPGIWQQTWKRGEYVRFILIGMIGWGLLSSIGQTKYPEATLLFWLLWALNYFVVFRSVPRLLSGSSLDQRVAFIMAVLIVGVIGSIQHPLYQAGRFVGVYGNATWTGHFFAATVVFAFALAITRRLRWPWLLFGTAVILLGMSRTRGGIGSAVIGLFVVIWVALQVNSTRSRRIVVATVILTSFSVVVLLWYLSETGRMGEAVQRAAVHLRVERGMESIHAARSMNQSQGAREFWNNGLLGRGFLSKYGDESTREIMGIAIPRYDWESDDDPLNSFYLVNQQIGHPGMLLFAGLLLAMLAAGWHPTPLARMLLLSLWCIGIFLGFFSVAWLVSFGDSWDRFCLVTFAALMHAPPDGAVAARNIRADARVVRA